MTGESGRTLLNFTHAGRELGAEAYSVKLTEEDGGYVLSAKLRRRDGSRLPGGTKGRRYVGTIQYRTGGA